MIPDYLLSQTLVRLRYPIVIDDYNNQSIDYDAPPATLEFKGWIQQDLRSQVSQDSMSKQGRVESEERWLLISNETDIEWRDRITGPNGPFVVYSKPELCYTPSGYHHVEATLQKVLDQ